jgi:hypothetical protein
MLAMIVGEEELASGKVSVRSLRLDGGVQSGVEVAQLADFVTDHLQATDMNRAD